MTKEAPAEDREKIISVGLSDLDYELDDIKKLDFDFFVYNYHHQSYEGSGFAIWRKGDSWFYHELGHCSCNGATDNIESSAGVAHTFEQVKAIAEGSYDGGYGKSVIEYIVNNHLN